MADETPKGLTPAHQNPWYVLATIYGEQTGERINWDLHARNRRAWNGWACGHLPLEEREKLAKQLRTRSQDLAPLNDIETNEIETRFKKRLPGLNIPRSTQFIDFRETKFSHPMILKKFIFPSTANFEDSVFETYSNFEFTVFSDIVSFKSAVFQQSSSFANAAFNDFVIFTEAEFSGTATFLLATFSGGAYFISATFSGSADFRSATFSGRVTFAQARFVATEKERGSLAVFFDTAFEKPLTFREVQFGDAYPNFAGALLPQNVTFSAADLVKDKESESLCKAWPDPKTVDQGKVGFARASCATIRHAVAQQGLPEEEHFFFRKEMTFAARDGALLTRLPYILFGFISNFGYSIARPTIGLVLVWAVGFLIFWALLSGGFLNLCTHYSNDGCGWAQYDPGKLKIAPFSSAFGLSFSNLFPFFGFRGLFFEGLLGSLPRGYQFLSACQTIGGFICLFFLGLGLRTRFRLR